MIFPWQKNEWQQLLQAKSANRLAHALLFTGMEGLGKGHFAHALAQVLLCKDALNPNHTNECSTCRLIAAKTHPDFVCITPEAGHAIKIDQIREVIDFINQSSLQGKYRIVLIHFAHQMNVNAANALLKTLEEPAPHSLLILITDQASRLPATIVSRCQRMHFQKPDLALACNWLKTQLPDGIDLPLMLKLANGAPLLAVKMAQDTTLDLRDHLFKTLELLSRNEEDPLRTALTYEECIPELLSFLLTWMMDLIELSLGKEDIVNQDYAKVLLELEKRCNRNQAIRFMEFLQQLQTFLNEGINLNKQLLVENIMVRWVGLFHVSS